MSLHEMKGHDACKASVPKDSQRVWFQRSFHNSGTIYLFPFKPTSQVKSWYAQTAFGWVPIDVAEDIWTTADEGWCNFWNKNDVKSLDFNPALRGLPKRHYVGFTDNVHYAMSLPIHMQKLAEETDYLRQNRHWKLPAHPAPAADVKEKEPDMGSYDMHALAREQQRRLAAEGNQVSLKDKCGSAVDTLLVNNKTTAKQAAFNEVGRIANNVAAKTLAKHLPAMARGYADTPIGKLLIANL